MVTIDEAQKILEEYAEALPRELYKELNGGILLLPDKIISEDAVDDDLFTLGEYCSDFVMGRYIVIYYGSFYELFKDSDEDEWREELKETLYHEFVHHIEDLAGERGLEIQDEEELYEYLKGNTSSFA
ncbi:MAG: metallopeptidase family protein [Eubacteriales bacterium]|nr:metallopeptidase family protein [Eubacteriales bacterium]MDD4389287.1 metallopeptidase family protein [Eubacteriales bacterium]